MKKTILLFGDLCIDQNNINGKRILGPGGASYFCAKILKGLGWQPIIVSPRGKDYKTDWLRSIGFYPEKTLQQNTLIYKNCYDFRGKRTLYARNLKSASFINPLSIPKDFYKKSRAVIVCPIGNPPALKEIKKLRIKAGKKTLFFCLAQGFFRRYKKNGKVFQSNWKNVKNIIPHFDIIFLSEEDGKNLDQNALSWSKLGPLIALTRAEKGCTVFQNGKKTDFPAFPVKKVLNPVGAGDVFSSAFIHARLSNKKIAQAAIFANKTAASHISESLK
ncbi:MAG: PfkB family carbohydrate kinase [bacterium]|nr:PfkB family carbohydrate kinase [bacterium]